jgi:drug/metabolite transporter (DMT)-like permease
MYIPIIGSFLEASASIIEKKILRENKIDYKNYTVYGFLTIVLVMIPFTFFLWGLSPEALKLKNILIFFAIVIISIVANILTYYSMKRKDLTELEPIRLMQPLLTIIMAFILSFFFAQFSSERNFLILALGIIASLALILPHVKKHHLSFNKYITAAVLGSFLFAAELVLSKFILSYYNSFTFYFLRCLVIFIITWIIFQPKIKSIKNKTKLAILLTSIIWTIYRIILYYGYNTYGILFTTIIMSVLTPVFIFIFAAIFLKEKIKLKHIISAAIIVICVIATIIIENKEIINSVIRALI